MTLAIANYIKLGSDSSDTLKFVRVDSTQAIKKDITFSRKIGIYNPKIQTFSVPEYRMIIRADVPTVEGYPSGQRISSDLSFRLPVKATAAMLEEQLTTLRELVNSEDFVNSVVQQLFPCEASCPAS